MIQRYLHDMTLSLLILVHCLVFPTMARLSTLPQKMTLTLPPTMVRLPILMQKMAKSFQPPNEHDVVTLALLQEMVLTPLQWLNKHGIRSPIWRVFNSLKLTHMQQAFGEG